MVSGYTVHEFSFQDVLRFTKPTWNETSVRQTSGLKYWKLVAVNLYLICTALLCHCVACCSWLSSSFFVCWFCYFLIELCCTCDSGQFQKSVLQEHEWLPLH
jgi:hypothetical protein